MTCPNYSPSLSKKHQETTSIYEHCCKLKTNHAWLYWSLEGSKSRAWLYYIYINNDIMHVSFWPQFPSNCLFGWSLANIQPKLQQHMQSSHSSFALRRGLKATYWPLAFTKMQSLQLFVLSTLITNFAVLWMQLFLHWKSIRPMTDHQLSGVMTRSNSSCVQDYVHASFGGGCSIS